MKLNVCGNEKLEAQVDTGATCNCMSRSTFSRKRNIKAASELTTDRKTKIRTYDNSIVHAIGSCVVTCQFDGRKVELPFIVLEQRLDTLLSGVWAEKIGAVGFHSSVERTLRVEECDTSGYEDLVLEFSDVFRGLGKFADEVKLELDPSVPPRQQAPRKT